MPTYEYVCEKCAGTFEKFQPIANPLAVDVLFAPDEVKNDTKSNRNELN